MYTEWHWEAEDSFRRKALARRLAVKLRLKELWDGRDVDQKGERPYGSGGNELGKNVGGWATVKHSTRPKDRVWRGRTKGELGRVAQSWRTHTWVCSSFCVQVRVACVFTAKSPYMTQAILELKIDPFASASQVRGLEACAICYPWEWQHYS